MEKLEHKGVTFESCEVKQTDKGVLNVKAYASVFGNVDSYRDIVDKGAFTKTIAEDRARIKVCVNHNIYNVYDVVGSINELKEDDKGLYVDVDILPTTKGKDLAILLESGAINELSIGYITKNSYESVIDGIAYRHLTEIKLLEFSFITRASNPEATTFATQRKSEESEIKAMNDEELTGLKAVLYEQLAVVETEFNSRVFAKL